MLQLYLNVSQDTQKQACDLTISSLHRTNDNNKNKNALIALNLPFTVGTPLPPTPLSLSLSSLVSLSLSSTFVCIIICYLIPQTANEYKCYTLSSSHRLRTQVFCIFVFPTPVS